MKYWEFTIYWPVLIVGAVLALLVVGLALRTRRARKRAKS